MGYTDLGLSNVLYFPMEMKIYRLWKEAFLLQERARYGTGAKPLSGGDHVAG